MSRRRRGSGHDHIMAETASLGQFPTLRRAGLRRPTAAGQPEGFAGATGD